MGLNIDLLPILGNELADAQPAGDHRVLPGGAAPAIDGFVAGCCRERPPVAS